MRARLDAEVMTGKIVAVIFLIAFVAALIVIIVQEHQPQPLLPMVQVSAPSCPRLSNPCDRIDCSKPNTKVIA
jgi:hypothetical protein